jgi:hypothetical protein
MLSYYAYAVYDSKESNNEIDAVPVAMFVASRRPETVAYYQEMISAACDEQVYPGCLIDPYEYTIMLKPRYQINKYDTSFNLDSLQSTSSNVFSAVDGTTVNLYTLDGKQYRLATYNSYDISSIQEYSRKYLDYFLETLKYKGITLDFTTLDPNRMYPITFCNPHVHLMAENHAIYYWGDDIEQFDPVTHHLWDTPTPATSASKCVIVKNERTIDVYTSPVYRHISDILYHNRSKYTKFYYTYSDAIRHQAYSILFNYSICFDVTAYTNSHFTNVIKECDALAEEMTNSFDTKCFRGVALPDRLSTQMTIADMRRQVRDYKTIALLVKAASCKPTPVTQSARSVIC